MSCIFCQIASHQAPAYIIYEDKDFMAFLDKYPLTTGHTLIIPKKHYRWVWDVKEYNKYMQVCRKLVNHFRKVTNNELVMSMILGQGVDHAHIRLIPIIDVQDSHRLFKGLETNEDRFLDDKQAEKLVKKLKLVS